MKNAIYFHPLSRITKALVLIGMLVINFFFFLISNSPQGDREWDIRTSDFRFMRCGLQSIELPLAIDKIIKIIRLEINMRCAHSARTRAHIKLA
jgi:hypothetical protein